MNLGQKYTTLKRKPPRIWKTSEKEQNRIVKQNGSQSSRIEQTGDRISELEDEMVIKGKTEELLIKQLKTCERPTPSKHQT
jgi:hypothetical protein